MRLMITGATGFIGSRLVPKLEEAGYEIGLLVRSSSNLGSLSGLKSLKVFNGDSYQNILSSFSRFKPDSVVHLAALYINRHAPEDVPALLQSNILFGNNILEAMSQCRIDRFLNFGTRWQHLEQTKDNPANLYAATKNAFQELLLYYHHHFGVAYTTLELCDTYGKGDPRKKIVELMVNACKEKTILQLSPGEQVLDIVCIDDLVTYIANGLGNDEFFHDDIFAISGEEIKLKDLGDKIEQMFGVSGILRWGERAYRKNEIMNPPQYYKIKKIKGESLEKQLMKQYL